MRRAVWHKPVGPMSRGAGLASPRSHPAFELIKGLTEMVVNPEMTMTVHGGAVVEGMRITELVKGPMTTQHLMRWSSAIENWHRIHYDKPFAIDHDKLPGLLVNGSWKQHVLVQMLKDWACPAGWVADLEFQYLSADVCGDTIVAFGEVSRVDQRPDIAIAHCDIGIRNQRNERSTTGTATLVLAPEGSDRSVPRTALDERSLPELPEPPQVSDHVSAETLARIGVPGAEVFAPEPVDGSSIRRLAQAIMDDDPICYDVDAAKAAGYDTVVAPPLFPLHIHRRRAGDADPLQGAIEHPDDDGAGDVITKHGLPPLDIPLPRLLNGGNHIQIFDLARLGDSIASVSVVADLREKTGRSGALVLVQIDTDYRAVNRDALLLRGRQTYIFR